MRRDGLKVASKGFTCDVIENISHVLYEFKLAKQIWHVNVQLENIVFH